MAAYSQPIRSLRTKLGGKRSRADEEWLIQVMFETCHSAEGYITHKTDKNEELRRDDAAAAKSLSGQRNAVHTLASFARQYGRQAGFALAAAGFRGREQDDGKKLTQAFVDMLLDYDKALSTTTQRSGPWLHRVACGNLIFARPIDSRRRHPSVGMGLLFHLVLLLRNYTSGLRSFARYQTGQPMPSHGEPHYDLAVEFVHVATDDEIRSPGAALRKLIRENPGIGLYHWPGGNPAR
jgi:hypothetical protein